VSSFGTNAALHNVTMNTSNRNILNLALLAIIVILVVFIVYEPGKDKTITPTKLTALQANDIQHVKISRQTTSPLEKTLEFIKMSDGWMMLKPYQLKANSFRIDEILKLLSAVSFSQNDLKKLNKSTFGLDKPQVVITFNNNISIKFGHNKSLKNHRYLEIGSTLHMIADTFQYQLVAKAESYIDHKLLPEQANIKKLVLPDFTLEKNDGRWSISPKSKTFSADSANQLMSEWTLSQAYDLNKLNALSESEKKANVILYLTNNQTIKFHIENSKDNFVLINIDTGIRYILSKDRRNKLLTLTDIESND
jgi:hypothetical protein